MSEGVFAVHRGVFKHPLFDGDEYSRRDAWLWLVGNALWEAKRVRVNKQMVELERGQLAFSERFLAEAWKWPKSNVHRFLACLSDDGMIVVKADHGVNRISIVNYDSYAFDGTRKRTARGPAADQRRTKEKENQENQENQESLLERTFDELRKVYPDRTPASPPKPAKQKLEAKLKEGHEPVRIVAGAKAYCAEQAALGNIGTRFVKTMEVWINQEGWEAYAPTSTGPPLPDDPIARRDFVRKQMEAENAAKQNSGTASRNLLGGGDGLRQKDHNGPEKPGVVRDQRRYTETTRSMVQLFSAAPRLSSVRIGGDEAEGHFGIPDAD